MSGLYNPNFSPARAVSPQIRSTPDVESNQYWSELLVEHQKIAPFMQVLPICNRLLNQEILRVSGMMPNQGFGELDRLRHRSPSPMASSNLMSNVPGSRLGGWNGIPQERLSGPPGMTMDWQGSSAASPSSYTVKRILRLEIPVDTFPNFNFVGRLLGPRGNSLKRVEATTGCRVYIRGKGSIKDPDKEDKLRGRPGYEHLNEPLHILIEADLPAHIVDIRLRQAQEIIEELLKPALLVNKTLYEKTIASGFGSVHFLLDASKQQQYILAYAFLLKAETGQELHRAIKLSERALVSADPIVTSLGNFQQVQNPRANLRRKRQRKRENLEDGPNISW